MAAAALTRERCRKPDDGGGAGGEESAVTSQVDALNKLRPAPLPMAEIVTDGDWRFTPYGNGDETIGCPKCRIPPADRPNGTFLHEGPGRYEPPPTHFLIRGDPDSKGSLLKPGFLTVATYGNPATEIPRPDGRTSGRRLALAEWIASPQNPLTARVIVNRAWYHHFGRGIVATHRQLRQDGRARRRIPSCSTGWPSSS